MHKMDKPKFILNPNALPFIPIFKSVTKIDFKEENEGGKVTSCDSATYEGIEVRDTLDSAWQPSSSATEKILIPDEDSPGIDFQIPESEDDIHQYETMGFEKQDMQENSQMESEYLSSLFPNFSLESVHEVYRACGDVVEAKLMLEQLEGQDDSSHSLPDDPHFSGASFSGHNASSSA